MRLISVIWKSILCQIRDYWALLLTISTAPLMVFIYWLIVETSSFTYNILVVNHDTTASQTLNYTDSIIGEFLSLNSSSVSFLNIKVIKDIEQGCKIISDKKADLIVEFMPGFNNRLKNIILKKDTILPAIKCRGDATSPKYSSALVLTLSYIQGYIDKIANSKQLYSFSEEFIGSSAKIKEFQIYVPGLMVLSIIMLIFTSALTLIREVEDRTLQRLMITRMTVFDYILGNTVTQTLVGILSITLTLLLVISLGFTVKGYFWVIAFISVITVVSIMGVSLIIVAVCRSVGTVLAFGNFPLFILMFFSGAMIPLPRSEFFSIAGHSFAFSDLLPPSHAVQALHKIMNLDQSFSDVKYEIFFLIILTVIYFAIGMFMFKRKHLRLKG